MGPIQKAPIIAKWISGLTERRNFQIRKFYSVGELYTIFVLPTVPDSACRQNYTYEAILGDEEVYRCDDVNDDVVQVIDQGMLLEMAFDET